MLDLFGGKKHGSQVSSVLDGLPTVRELKSHSKKYSQSWLRRREWLLRKVNRLEYVDRTTLSCSLSYDVDILHFRDILGDAQSIHGRDRSRMLLPLDDLLLWARFSEGLPPGDYPWRPDTTGE